MKAEDIKVGMWLRWSIVDAPVRAADMASREDGCFIARELNGAKSLPAPHECEPWTPRVGEWVRDSMTGVTREVASMWESHGTWWSSGDGVYGRVSDSEPCLPPAPPTTYLRADGVEVPTMTLSAKMTEATPEPSVSFLYGTNDPVRWYTDAEAEAQSEAIYRQWQESRQRVKEAAKVEFKPGANSTCLKCGGLAYLGLQESKCLAPKCERVEPEPEMLLQPMAKSRNGWRVEDGPRYEDIWIACGRGKEVSHPIREEAIRLWKEAVYKPDGCTCNDDCEVGSGYRCKACKEADRKRGARG